jgi:hypothetical protein
MDVETLLACESIGEYDGRITLEGIIDRLPVNPATKKIGDFCAFLRLRWDMGDLKKAHRLVMNLIDYDGVPLAPPIVTTEFPQRDKYANMIFPIRDIFARNCSEYRLDIFIDGMLKSSLPLTIYRQQVRA